MPSVYVPVSPSAEENGVIDSLAAIAPANELKLGDPPNTTNYSVINVRTSQVTQDLIASLKYSTLINATSTGASYYYLLEALTTLSTVQTGGTVITGQVYGLGLRLAIKTWSIDASLTANVSLVAASVELNASGSSYIFETIGVGLESLSACASLYQGIGGKFDIARLSAFSGAIEDVMDYLIANASTLTPRLLGVTVDMASINTAFTSSISGIYALNQIIKGNSLTNAMQNIPLTLPADEPIQQALVSSVYAQVVGTDPTQKPSKDQINLAKQVITIGS